MRCWWTPWPSWTSAVPVEPDPRDVARDGLVEDRLGGRPEGRALGDPDQAFDLRAEVEGDGVVVRRDQDVDQRDGDLAGLDADLLLAELVDHVVLAVSPSRASCRRRPACRRCSAAPARCARPRGPATCRRPAGRGSHRGDRASRRGRSASGSSAFSASLKPGMVVGRELLEHAEVDEHPHDPGRAQKLGPAARASRGCAGCGGGRARSAAPAPGAASAVADREVGVVHRRLPAVAASEPCGGLSWMRWRPCRAHGASEPRRAFAGAGRSGSRPAASAAPRC